MKCNSFGTSQRLQSPIHIAAEQGYSEICKLLLNAGANIEQREQVNMHILVYNNILIRKMHLLNNLPNLLLIYSCVLYIASGF